MVSHRVKQDEKVAAACLIQLVWRAYWGDKLRREDNAKGLLAYDSYIRLSSAADRNFYEAFVPLAAQLRQLRRQRMELETLVPPLSNPMSDVYISDVKSIRQEMRDFQRATLDALTRLEEYNTYWDEQGEAEAAKDGGKKAGIRIEEDEEEDADEIDAEEVSTASTSTYMHTHINSEASARPSPSPKDSSEASALHQSPSRPPTALEDAPEDSAGDANDPTPSVLRRPSLLQRVFRTEADEAEENKPLGFSGVSVAERERDGDGGTYQSSRERGLSGAVDLAAVPAQTPASEGQAAKP